MTHPTAKQLEAFALGKLAPDRSSLIAAHLQTCDTCREKVDTQPPDSFVAKIQAASPRGGTLPPPPPSAQTAPPPKAAPPKKSLDVPPELLSTSKFDVVSKLGEGGMGSVWKAKHAFLDAFVAIKVMKPEAGKGEMQDRFLQEMRAAGKLQHRHIVRAFDAERVGDSFLLVLEYVEGINLDQLIKQKGRLRVDFACRLISQAAEGLQHAHEKGMVHRDIKPANLMITRAEKEIKILDFGLARLTQQQAGGRAQTQAQTFMGTPEYVAPEQASDARSADIRADIYSLGCTLYFLLTGKPPFQADTVLNVIVAHLQEIARPLSKVRPDVPEGLSAVVMKMLAKKPEDRHQTPADVVAALRPYLTLEKRPTNDGGETAAYAAGKATPLPSRVTPPPLPEGFDFASEEEPARRNPKRRRRGWLPVVVGGCVGALLLLSVVTFLLTRGGKGDNSARSGLPPDHPGTQPPEQQGQPPKEAGIGRSQDPWGKSVTNSIGMKLVEIPPGTFPMGSPEAELGRDGDERQHTVEITKPFWMGVHEVTQEQYQRVMGKNPSHFSAAGDGAILVRGTDTSNFPVENVTWDDAVEFCRRLSDLFEEKRLGRRYRLPTEAEWEYACRAGSADYRVFSVGNGLTSTQANMNGDEPFGRIGFLDAPKGPFLRRTCPVGSYSPNDFGLYDMHGNVWELCSDWYSGSYYDRSPRQDPENTEREQGRVMRGGSWCTFGKYCRSAYRQSTWITGTSRPDQVKGVGLRVVVTPR